MKLETQVRMTQRAENSDYRDVLTVAFAMFGPDAGQLEWLLDRIEGKSGAPT